MNDQAEGLGRRQELEDDLSDFELVDNVQELHDIQPFSTHDRLRTGWIYPTTWLGMLSGSKPVPALYERLSTQDSIRLFTLQPGAKDRDSGPVYGTLSSARLGDKPEYYALSYVWGDPKVRVPLRCGKFTLQITRNLDEALRQFRMTFKHPIQIWVDAICIDQNTIAERNHQVRNMGQIYKQAERVLVWLGTSSIVPSPAFEGAKRIVEDVEFAEAYVARWKWDLLTEAFRELTCQEWFFRTWTSQEIGLARQATFFHGPNVIDWHTLFRAFDFIECEVSTTALKSKNYHFDRVTFLYLSFINKSFRELLVHTGERFCSDPRDKVFALLSHSSAMDAHTGRPLIDVNYAHSECRIAAETVSAIIHAEKSLDVLAFRMDKSYCNWPSWVPTLHILTRANVVSKLPRELDASGACGLDHVEIQIEGEYSHTLVVSGFVIDSINTSAEVKWYGKGYVPGSGYSFRTEKLGLKGASLARFDAGDIVLVLCGSKVPFIARFEPIITRPTEVRLISPCYVENLMHGEIDEFVHQRKVRRERIHII